MSLRNRTMFCMQVTVSHSETNKKGYSHEVKEQYVVEAASFIDAEQRIHDEMNYNNRPIMVKAISRPKFEEICFSDDISDSWYKAKTQTTEYTDSGKEKKVSHYFLVQAPDNQSAINAVNDVIYKDSIEDYEIADIVKTRILDVLENDKHLATLANKDANGGEEKLS